MTELSQRLINFNKWDETKVKFRKFHFANPHIYQTFSIYSWDAAKAGHKVFSHWLIMNRIRWDSLIQTDGEKYKIPNEFIAFYARMFMIRYPQLGAFFKICSNIITLFFDFTVITPFSLNSDVKKREEIEFSISF